MKKWKKYLLYGVIGFLMIGTIGVIFGEKQDVKAISIEDTQLAMDVDKEKTFEISIEPSDVRLSKSDFVIGDESLVEIDSIDGHIVTLKTLKNEGTTTLYCQRNDIKSNEITLQVTDQQKLASSKAEEQRKAEAKIVEEKKAEDEKKAADAKKAQEQTAKKSTTKNTTSASSTKSTGQQVYITRTGKKYHAIAKCGNTKSSTLVSLSDARSSGLSACSKCY